MDPAQDTESLVRLTANSAEREEKEEGGDEVVGKCEELRRPMPQHVMEKKPPWMSSLLPTPLLPLPTLNFTVSQVSNPILPNQIFYSCRISSTQIFTFHADASMREAFQKTKTKSVEFLEPCFYPIEPNILYHTTSEP